MTDPRPLIGFKLAPKQPPDPDPSLLTRCPTCRDLAVDHLVDSSLLRCRLKATQYRYAAPSPLGRSVVAAVKAARAEARKPSLSTVNADAGAQPQMFPEAR